MGRASPSSSFESSSNNHYHYFKTNLSTDLRLGLNSVSEEEGNTSFSRGREEENEENECNSGTLYVKVYMEGIPIGRKLDLLALNGYHHLVTTLDYMFNTNILWAEAEQVHSSEQCHVLTYEDKEGDWMMVGDVPWEMFLSAVRRLKITRVGIS
ncbi:hypothetical protein ACFE04_017832 [Oxalis oulophora]